MRLKLGSSIRAASFAACWLAAGEARALTRCDVMVHAQAWVDAGIMYSQGPSGGYCPGALYCDPNAGDACYRPDCSGFVSAVWGLPAPGNTTYKFAGGPWDDGSSYPIPAGELAPGDALNFGGDPSEGSGHIMLFGGWIDGDKFWVLQENLCNTPANYAELYWSNIADKYLPIRYVGIEECVAPAPPLPALAQLTGNRALTLVNWSDGHTEIFAKTKSGMMQHAGSDGATDTWNVLAPLDGGAACGVSATFSSSRGTAELFAPTADGTVAHLWWTDAWSDFQDLGGEGLSELTSLAWSDGHVEVFALGEDHAIWHDYLDAAGAAWSGWSKLGGEVATGASAALWGDGHAEVFATDAEGTAWHTWSGDFPGGWSDWVAMGGKLASRPVPVRWSDGHLEVFALGKDGHLQHSAYGVDWGPFEVLDPDTKILGEPSVIMNPPDAGAPAGPEVLARDQDGTIVHLAWDGAAWTTFAPIHHQKAAGDPFGWTRADGRAEIFAIDPEGALARSYRDPATGWSSWTTMGSGLDPCIATTPGPSGSSGGFERPSEEVAGDASVPADDSGCACRAAGSTSSPSETWLALGVAFAATVVSRRRRTSAR